MFAQNACAERYWAKTEVKGMMRPALSQRIVALCKATGRNLKRKISLPPVLPLTLVLTTGSAQSSLGRFGQAEDSNQTAPTETETDESDVKNDPDDSDDKEAPRPDDKPRGLIYARVSSGGQLDNEDTDGVNEDTGGSEYDEGSIQGQIEELTELGEKEGIHFPYDPITDKAQTGTNFDRDGIQEVFEISKNKDIDYLLVEKVDRIGRNAPETLYFIYILQSECEVTLLTPSGERDVNDVEGLTQTTLLSLMAEVQNTIRTEKAKKERIRGFLKKKNWKCKSPKIPLGYNLIDSDSDEDDNGWIEINPEEKEIVRDLFRSFAECQKYSETEEYIDNKYGPEVLDGHKPKTLLTNSVYIGKPRLPEEWVTDTTYENDLEDQSLHLLQQEENASVDVSEKTFREVQEIIQEKNKKHSSDEDTQELLDFIEEFSLFSVIEGSDAATLLHHCGEPLVTDGQLELNGRKVHRYRCRKCEESVDAESYYRKWPRQDDLDKIELIHRVTEEDSDPFDHQ